VTTATATATPLRAKALAVLRSGRLQVLKAQCNDSLDLVELVCRVRSSREGVHPYAVDYLDETWTCTCRLGAGCAHIAAARLIAGVPA
jgi:hypothetical protein